MTNRDAVWHHHWSRRAITLLLAFCSYSAIAQQKITIVREESQKAYKLLNEIRQNPERYYGELKFGRGDEITRTPLAWNDTLARIAEAKAKDMATRNYFNHIDPDGYGMNFLIKKGGYKLNPDWVKNKRDNTFESLGMGLEGGEAAIKTLIIDEGVPDQGHRKHLLGIGEWYSSLKDIGIGYVLKENGDEWETYICVLIAKHDW
ncbi:MAG: CAP domain-containing protein [Taibaiella sp.]|nr:CAP domain-containing protein [Taibaiella sp.]